MKRMILAVMVVMGMAAAANAQNPYLPSAAFIPDGEPHVFTHNGETRVYVYGSRDEMVTSFCGKGHDVWSASVDDLSQWTNYGEAVNVQQILDLGYGRVDGQVLFAPDCVYNPITEKYYMYIFLGKPYKMDGVAGPKPEDSFCGPCYQDWGPTCFVVESDSPAGPFVNPIPCDWPTITNSGPFDPAVLVDEQQDGSVRVYAYFGNIQPNSFWAELSPTDMHTIINGNTRMPDRSRTYRILNNPSLNGNTTVFEASSIRKVADGKYVYICSSNENMYALTYFYANSPEGPWTFGGELVDNHLTWNGGNNHGGIEKCGDQWYLFYHRMTNDNYNRQGCLEPIDLRIENDRVIIPAIEMTSQGYQKEGLKTNMRYWAGTICSLKQGDVWIDGKMRTEDGLHDVVVGTANPTFPLNNDGTDAYMGWKYFNLTTDINQLILNAQVETKTTGYVMIAEPDCANDKSTWQTIGTFTLKPDKVFKDYRIAIKGINGMKAVYLVFDGTPRLRIKEIALVNPEKPISKQDNRIPAAVKGDGSGTFTSEQIDEAYFDGTWQILPDNSFFGLEMKVRFWHEGEDIKMEVLDTTWPQVKFKQIREIRGRRIVMTADGGGYPLTVTIDKWKPNVAAGRMMSGFACHAERVLTNLKPSTIKN